MKVGILGSGLMGGKLGTGLPVPAPGRISNRTTGLMPACVSLINNQTLKGKSNHGHRNKSLSAL
jgi:hypothetical protein